MGKNSRRVRRLLACGLLSSAACVMAAVPALATVPGDGDPQPEWDPHAQHGAGPTVKVRPHGKAGSDVFSVQVRAVGEGQRSAGDGAAERVSYEIVVRNRTAQDFPQAEIVQMLAGGAKVLSSAPEGFVDQEWLVWQLGLDAKESRTLRSTVMVPQSDDADAPRSRSAVCVRVETAAGFSGCGADERPLKKHSGQPHAAHGAPGAAGAPAAGDHGSDGKHAAVESAPRAAAVEDEPFAYKRLLIASAVAAGTGLLAVGILRMARRRAARR
ncbi:hypothetical protein [Streptomyces indicus]|uniref:DUF11 domain-containing protein n=1 Tax=Streptomyces indicus TaxID=417292 RepID=A0A1G8T5A1_9ACTN|nr:hypothetical protein [Streptomyces indicus]SDJ36779.1 hypothetical protein SAMN05421806_10169 [Streptomyces indicus]